MIPAHIEHVFKALDRIEQRSPASAATVDKPLSHDKNDAPHADTGTAGVGALDPVTCRARYYDAASRILEEEGQLLSHDNADELGHVIERWIEETRDNWEPR
jgi:hypothetical protein